jgi:hypothetical protein
MVLNEGKKNGLTQKTRGSSGLFCIKKRKKTRIFGIKLHISKKSSIFALDLGKRSKGRQKDATRRVHREHASAVRR